MACADDAKASAKATVISLIICFSPVDFPPSRVAALWIASGHIWDRRSLIWINECRLPSWVIRIRGAPTKPPLRLARRHWAQTVEERRLAPPICALTDLHD